MRTVSTDVVVVGGGATGAGVVRDLAMRGYAAVLVERADLGQGTTGRFHGLLHSGGRYVVSDPTSAAECARENAIVTRINADAVEATGGYFVTTPGDDPGFADQFLAAASATGVPAREIPVREALRCEPGLNPAITRAIEVRDGAVDGWRLVWGAAGSAIEYGASVLTYHRLTKVVVRDGAVVGVECHDRLRDEPVRIDCSFVINCAGAWAGEVAGLAGCADVEVVAGRGVMIAMGHRLVNRVINRCVYPTDGDILVPAHTVCIIGTTDVRDDDPDHLAVPPEEVQQLLDSGEALVPGFRRARAVHAWAGARPLIRDARVAESDTRHMSRGLAILDHLERDGLRGLLTIAGGKLTTYRLMAELVVDRMCAQLGETRACRTADEVVPAAASGTNHLVTSRLARREADRLDDQLVCECELVTRSMLVRALAGESPDPVGAASPAGPLGIASRTGGPPTGAFAREPSGSGSRPGESASAGAPGQAVGGRRARGAPSLDDVRRQLRLGMGPCQGGFCSLRAAGIACGTGHADPARATALLRRFLGNRWIGLWPILYGDQVRQTALDAWIGSTLGVAPLPADEEVVL